VKVTLENPPAAQSSDKVSIALQFVVNYNEGGQNSVLYGDDAVNHTQRDFETTQFSKLIARLSGVLNFSNLHASHFITKVGHALVIVLVSSDNLPGATSATSTH